MKMKTARQSQEMVEMLENRENCEWALVMIVLRI